MKKIIPICIVGILMCTAFGAAALTNDEQIKDNEDQGNRSFTHSVFAEFGTTSTCGYCPYAHMALKNIYYGQWYPFYFISFPTNKNTHAATRMSEYNLYGVPDTFFDGGYRINYGAYTNVQQMMSWYNTSINQCGARAVPNIDTTLNVNWLGDATMDIQVSVQNMDNALYNGRLRVYVTEVESTMGWKDAQNHPYTFPFLDYAFNQVITIDPSGTWSNSVTWNGNNYNDGYGHSFGSIQNGNIMVIATVFNATGHSAYSDPPDNAHPFTAYYVDDCTGFFVGSSGPNPPSNPHPVNGATGVDLDADMSWTGGGSPGLTITYDVYFGTTSTPLKVSSNQSGTTYNPGTMEYSTMYYWKIVAWDQNGNSSEGPLWHFTTVANPNNPPDTPTITGPSSGKPGSTYKYTISATDPESDPIEAYIDWGDGTNSGWIGPYTSGVDFYVNHVWSEKGTYTVQVKVRDSHGAESGWATLDVTMPTSYSIISTPFLHWLFEQFPHAFPMLRHLLGM
jgi:hypothetical protein